MEENTRTDLMQFVPDFVKHLPSELVAHIFSFLDHTSLMNCERVSRLWQEVARSPHVWRETFKNQYGPWKSKPGNDWKKMFHVRQELDLHWRQGKVNEQYLRGHTDSVYCVQFDESVLFS